MSKKSKTMRVPSTFSSSLLNFQITFNENVKRVKECMKDEETSNRLLSCSNNKEGCWMCQLMYITLFTKEKQERWVERKVFLKKEQEKDFQTTIKKKVISNLKVLRINFEKNYEDNEKKILILNTKGEKIGCLEFDFSSS
jgi:hypothetical protein